MWAISWRAVDCLPRVSMGRTLIVTMPASRPMSASTTVNSTSENARGIREWRFEMEILEDIRGLQHRQHRGEGDEADHHHEEQDQNRLEHGRQTLAGGRQLLVVAGGEAVEHFFKPARRLADGEDLHHHRWKRAGGFQ